VTWGDYRLVKPEEEPGAQGEGEPGAPTGAERRRRPFWQRTPRSAEAVVSVTARTGKPVSMDLPGSDGLRLVASVRAVPDVDVTADGANRLVP
jgi:hypothetical protein